MRFNYLKTAVTFFFLSVTTIGSAQEFEDLIILYADGKYDKCLVKAEKYTDDDDTKRHPLPYLYMSMSFFEISKDASWVEKNEEFDGAFKDALSYAGKYAMKDARNDWEYHAEYLDFFLELQEVVLEDCRNYLADEDFSRAAGELGKLVRFMPNDPGAWLLNGVANQRNRNARNAMESFQESDKILEAEDFNFENLEDVQKEILKVGMMEYAKMQEYFRKKEEGIKMLDKGKIYFENDEEFAKFYDEYVNG